MFGPLLVSGSSLQWFLSRLFGPGFGTGRQVRLTGYLQFLLDRIPSEVLEVVTPRAPEARGCQLSIRVRRRSEELFRRLHEHGFVGDVRKPDIIRVAPVPLYNTFHEVWRLASEIGRDVETL